MKFADPKNKKYPIDDREEIRAAWSYIHMPRNQKEYTRNELYEVMRAIEKAWRQAFGEPPPEGKRLANHQAKFVGCETAVESEEGGGDDRPPHVSSQFGGNRGDDDVVRRERFAPGLRGPGGKNPLAGG